MSRSSEQLLETVKSRDTAGAAALTEHRPRRVLHVLNSASGGAALSTLELIAALRDYGIDSVVVCHDSGTAEERQLVSAAVGGRAMFRPLYWWNKKIRSRRWKRPLIELLQLWKTGWKRTSTADVVRFARRYDVDLIHTNTSLTPEGAWAAKRSGLPHVWHIRELIGEGMPYRFPREGTAFGRFLSDHASLIIANSNVSADAIRGWLPADVLRVVRNGIDLRPFNDAVQSVRRDRLVVGMVASLTSGMKKHSLFLEAAARLSPSLRIEFHLFGHLPKQDRVRREWQERVRSLGLTDRFHFPGFIADTAKLMNALDILVHPSEHESFGRVIVEAMAAGKPVVGVQGGGVGEIVIDEETGLLCPPNDVPGLVRRIERLAGDHDLRARLGSAGRNRAQTHFSIDRCAQEMVAVYAEAVLHHPAARSQTEAPKVR